MQRGNKNLEADPTVYFMVAGFQTLLVLFGLMTHLHSNLSEMKPSIAKLLQFKCWIFRADPTIGFRDRWNSIIAQTHHATIYKIWQKWYDLRRSYSHLKIEKLGVNPTRYFKVSGFRSLRDLRNTRVHPCSKYERNRTNCGVVTAISKNKNLWAVRYFGFDRKLIFEIPRPSLIRTRIGSFNAIGQCKVELLMTQQIFEGVICNAVPLTFETLTPWPWDYSYPAPELRKNALINMRLKLCWMQSFCIMLLCYMYVLNDSVLEVISIIVVINRFLHGIKENNFESSCDLWMLWAIILENVKTLPVTKTVTYS